MGTTKIEWAEKSWNPVTGCTKISSGCANCYAERMAKRLRGRYGYPQDDPFKVTLHPDRLNQPMKWRKPSRIFVCSMGDLFHEDVEWNFTYKVFEMMLLANHHTFIVLTKRSKRMKKWMNRIWFHLSRNYPEKELPLKNVIGMVSVENQKRADERIPDLIETIFAIKGISMEPLLESVNLYDDDEKSYLWDYDYQEYVGSVAPPGSKVPSHYRLIDHVIIGAESGHNRRECKIEWVENIVDQCQNAGVSVFVKQLHIDGKVSKDMSEWPAPLRIRRYPNE